MKIADVLLLKILLHQRIMARVLKFKHSWVCLYKHFSSLMLVLKMIKVSFILLLANNLFF